MEGRRLYRSRQRICDDTDIMRSETINGGLDFCVYPSPQFGRQRSEKYAYKCALDLASVHPIGTRNTEAAFEFMLTVRTMCWVMIL